MLIPGYSQGNLVCRHSPPPPTCSASPNLLSIPQPTPFPVGKRYVLIHFLCFIIRTTCKSAGLSRGKFSRLWWPLLCHFQREIFALWWKTVLRWILWCFALESYDIICISKSGAKPTCKNNFANCWPKSSNSLFVAFYFLWAVHTSNLGRSEIDSEPYQVKQRWI